MKNNENMELLTAELYQKISSDKGEKIVALKNIRTDVISKMKSEREALKQLEEQKKDLEKKIRLTKANISCFKNRKFKLTKEIGVQKRLSNKINKLITKDDSYVDVDKFYPEVRISKKR